MIIEFNLNVVTHFAAVSIGIFTSLLLFFSRENRVAKRILAFLMLAITCWVLDAFFRSSGIYRKYPSLYFLPIYYSFSFGPLLYFYVQAITNQSFKPKKNDLFHFIPVMIQALFYWCITFQPYKTKYFIWFKIHQPITYRIEYDGTWLSLVIYLFLAIQFFRKYQKWLPNHYSNISPKMLNWLKISLIALILLCGAWFFEAILRDFRNTYYQYDVSTNLLCLIIYCICILGIQETSNGVEFIGDNAIELSNPTTNPDERVVDSIQTAMNRDKLYLNPELSLNELAKYLNLSPKTVSFHINAAFKQSFNTYINSFRVEEIKKRLKSSDLEKYTLLAIAFEAGFNSKTSFNRIFKDFTGSSPSDFIKK